MPKRMNTRRFVSTEMQGEDSYVVVSRLTVGEAKEIHKIQSAKADDEDANIDDLNAVLPLYAEHIKDWNWVDDDGKPLPLPNKDQTVLDRLTDAEFAYLGDILAGEVESEEIKN